MTKAVEWKARAAEHARAEAEELPLPSGMVILARRPDGAQLAVWGHLPMQLAAAAVKAGETLPILTPDQTMDLLRFYRELLTYCLVDPRISLTPGENEIHPRDVCAGDWDFIVRWAMRFEEGRNLEGFRGERPGTGAGGGGADVGTAAVNDARDQGPGGGVEF
jgi:hypothetical protein